MAECRSSGLAGKEIREFLDWVYDRAVADEGTNPGRTANKAREHLRAVVSWAWEQDLIDSLPRFPKPRPQRDVAGRHYLTKAEINALYFATHQLTATARMERLRFLWEGSGGLPSSSSSIMAWIRERSGSRTPIHEPILWRHICWDRESPDPEVKQHSPWGWLYYRRVKTCKAFYRPMNRVVHAHIKSLMPDHPCPDDPVFLGGSSRPNSRFGELCRLAGIGPKTDVETGAERAWMLKDRRISTDPCNLELGAVARTDARRPQAYDTGHAVLDLSKVLDPGYRRPCRT